MKAAEGSSVDTAMQSQQLRRLFDQFNRRYWRGRLPHYEVVVCSKYTGGCCEKNKRRIMLNPALLDRGKRVVQETLIHEMAHAAVLGTGHGSAWQSEMKRLAGLKAPISEEDLDEKNVETNQNIFSEFFDIGLEKPTVRWSSVKNIAGRRYGLVDDQGKPLSRRAALILKKARRAFHRGQRIATPARQKPSSSSTRE